MVFAAVQGTVIRVLTTGQPDEMLFRQTLDALNYMMADEHLPKEMRVRVRDYFRRTRSMFKRKSYFELVDHSLSNKLRTDVRYHITQAVFQSVWWLRQCEKPFLIELSTQLSREAFAKDERIPGTDQLGEPRMCIMALGIASRAGTILTSGMWWGDIIISSTLLRDMRPAKALGYCEIVAINRAGLDAAVANFPASALSIREASLRICTQRAMIVIASYARIREKNLPKGEDGAAPAKQSAVEVLKEMRRVRFMPSVLEWQEPDELAEPPTLGTFRSGGQPGAAPAGPAPGYSLPGADTPSSVAGSPPLGNSATPPLRALKPPGQQMMESIMESFRPGGGTKRSENGSPPENGSSGSNAAAKRPSVRLPAPAAQPRQGTTPSPNLSEDGRKRLEYLTRQRERDGTGDDGGAGANFASSLINRAAAVLSGGPRNPMQPTQPARKLAAANLAAAHQRSGGRGSPTAGPADGTQLRAQNLAIHQLQEDMRGLKGSVGRIEHMLETIAAVPAAAGAGVIRPIPQPPPGGGNDDSFAA